MTLYQGPCTKCGFFGVISSTRTICNRCYPAVQEEERMKRLAKEAAERPPFQFKLPPDFWKCNNIRCNKVIDPKTWIYIEHYMDGAMGPYGGGHYCSLECSRQ